MALKKGICKIFKANFLFWRKKHLCPTHPRFVLLTLKISDFSLIKIFEWGKILIVSKLMYALTHNKLNVLVFFDMMNVFIFYPTWSALLFQMF